MSAVAIALAGACGDNLVGDEDEVMRCTLPGAWRPLPAFGIAGRVDHTAVWTGAHMIVWGGTQAVSQPFADGTVFDPGANMPHGTQAPIEPRDDHAAVWTGSEMIVWGGNSYDEDINRLNDGGRYDPRSAVWRGLSFAGLTPRDDPRAVWTGSEMIVWGGHDDYKENNDGGRYDPVTDRWRPVSVVGAPEPREDHTMVWTGREMIVWGGWNGPDTARNYDLSGGRYDPATDTWRPMSRDGAPPLREDHSAIWTGKEMVVWGGVVRDGSPPMRHRLATGGRYDPATDTWRPITDVGAPSAREDDVVVWTGTEMIVWGGRGDSALAIDAARYSPAFDRWCPVATDGGPPVTHDAAGVWTGTEMIVWGGDRTIGAGASYSDSGGAYTPP